MTVLKLPNRGDNRNTGSCVHCGVPNETRDHRPSVVFLDEPLPLDLPASPSCERCNQGFSNDEAYLACLLECVVAGSADPDRLHRQKIAALMLRRPSIAAELAAARQEAAGQIVFHADLGRVGNVVLKLARCHVAFELIEPRLGEPDSLWFKPLERMDTDERYEFENEGALTAVWPEVGSRALMRTGILGSETFGGGWLEVQPDRYCYCTSQDNGLRVRTVIREYLDCEAVWR